MKEKQIWAVCLTALGAAAMLLGLTRLLWAGVPDARSEERRVGKEC